MLLVLVPGSFFGQSTVLGDPAGRTMSNTITADGDGNFYTAACENNLGLLVKQDSLRNIVWKRNFTFAGATSYSILPTSLSVIGDTLFGCGFIADLNHRKGGFYFKVNAQTGAVYWMKSDVTSTAYLNCMRYANGKYLLVGGFTAPNATFRGKVLAVSSATGDLIWETSSLRFEYPSLSPGFRTELNQATEVVNGKMYIVGTSESHGNPGPNNISHIILMGIDESGNIFLKKHFDFPGSAFEKGQNIAFDGTDLVITYNSERNFLSGWLWSPTMVMTGVIKCDLQGNVIFSRSYHLQNNSDTYLSTLNVTDDSYVISGIIYWAENGAFLLKLSRSGNFEACRMLYKPSAEYDLGPGIFNDIGAGGASTFINGKHYMVADQFPYGALPWTVHQIITDEDLNMDPLDCATNVPGTELTSDVPVTTQEAVLVQASAPMVFQDGFLLSVPGNLTLCDNIALETGQNPACSGALVHAAATGFTNPTYYWSNGDTGDSITVSVTDTLVVTVVDVNCCRLTDTLVPVIATYELTMHLPADTVICQQAGGFYTIVPTVTGPNPVAYHWNNGSALPTLVTGSSGLYRLEVSDSCFTVRDSMTIEFRPLPSIVAPATVSVCEGNFPATLSPVVSPGSTVSWNDGPTTVNRPANAPGNYSITATNSCGSESTIITVNELQLPEVELQNLVDTCLQQGEQITLVPVLSFTDNSIWSTGSTASQLSVTASGTYTIYGSNQCGTDSASCSATIHLFPELFLPAVLDTCWDLAQGLNYTAQGTPGTYQWSNGPSTATGFFPDAGTYTLTLTNICGAVTASMVINRYSDIGIFFPHDSILVCANQIPLSDLLIETNYDMIVYDENREVAGPTISTSGWYRIYAYNDCSSAWDSIYVNLQNEQLFYLPNTFTPNADSHNELFRFEGENIVIKQIRIFNRWGEEVYAEENGFTGWDGTYNGDPAMEGMYAVSLVYENCFGIPTAFNGHVNLLR